MTNRSKAKGDRGELEVQAIFQGAGFLQAQRPRAGSLHDRGDLAGIPDLTIQVKNIDDLARAITQGSLDLVTQKRNNRTPWGVLAFKRRMRGWYACMPLEEFAALYADYHECKAIAAHVRDLMTRESNGESSNGSEEVHPNP